MSVRAVPAGPVQRCATVTSREPFGGYTRLVLQAPGLPAARPGQFVTVAVGGPDSALILRRAFGIHAIRGPALAPADPGSPGDPADPADPADPGSPGDPGPLGDPGGVGTVSIVVAAAGAGSRWLTERRPGDLVDLVGPLGRGFAEPVADERLVLVGGGYGAAPLAWAAREAVSVGAEAHAVLGAATAARLCDVEAVTAVTEAGGGSTVVTTDDGSAGERGRVTGPVERLVRRLLADGTGRPVRVGACGPMAMLRAIAAIGRPEAAGPGVTRPEVAGSDAVRSDTAGPDVTRPDVAGSEVAGSDAVRSGRLRLEVAVEEAMACGVGVCMTCVLPVVDPDGRTRMLRACREGAVFDAARVRWDAIGACGSAVPADAVGAPEGGAA